MVVLKGLLASPGIGSGNLRFIDEQSVFEAFKGEIIVVLYSNPIFTIALLEASGLIICNGGVLAHLASIAREMHIPCIVNCPDIEVWAKKGCLAILNANNGIVQIKE